MADEKYSPESNDGYGFRSDPSRPAGHVDVSGGTEMPDGILSMKPLAKVPTAARQSINVTPNRITADLRARLDTMTPETAQRVRAVVARKR